MDLADYRELIRRIRALEDRTGKLPTRGGAGGGGGAGAQTAKKRFVYCHLADSVAELIDISDSTVNAYDIARIEDGDDKGREFMASAEKDEWIDLAPVMTVEALPAIPTAGMREVYWTDADAGTGDNQVWRAFAGQTAWTPTQKFTSKSGVPV